MKIQRDGGDGVHRVYKCVLSNMYTCTGNVIRCSPICSCVLLIISYTSFTIPRRPLLCPRPPNHGGNPCIHHVMGYAYYINNYQHHGHHTRLPYTYYRILYAFSKTNNVNVNTICFPQTHHCDPRRTYFPYVVCFIYTHSTLYKKKTTRHTKLFYLTKHSLYVTYF